MVQQVDELFNGLSGQLGASPDQLKLISLLLLSIPLSVPLPRLPASSSLTHVYSIALSYLYLTQFLYLHSGYLQLFAQCVATWLAVKFCRAYSKPKSWTWAIFLGNMGLLTVNHFARYISNTSLDIVEITGSQMVLVMKLSLFAWAAYDGGRPIDQLDPVQKRDRLPEVPGLLPFLGYCFFLPSIMTGPSFTYRAYAAYTDRSLFANRKGSISSLGMPTGRWRKASKRAAIGGFYLAVFALYGYKYSYERMLDPGFGKRGFFQGVLFVQLAGLLARTKYYAVWSFAEAGMIVSGLGWDPEECKWNRGRNVQIREIETAQSFKTLLDAWNIGTNFWLRECMYKRLARPGKKPGFKSTMATFATSAFWHGFNPTYYVTFVLGGLFQSLGRTMRKNVRPFFLPADYALLSPEQKKAAEKAPIKRVYDVLSTVAVLLSLNFIVIPFILLEIAPTLKAWSQVGYYGLFLCVVPFAAFNFGLGRDLKKRQKTRAQKAGVTDEAVTKLRVQSKKESDKGVEFVPNVPQAAKEELRKKA